MAIDLEQFHQVFFEESLEGLDAMEQVLLEISSSGINDEAINTIFRAAHSIKGGSGTFGFTEITDFTHVMETLLDEARDGKRQLTEDVVELLLKSCDCLRAMVDKLQTGEPIDNSESQPLIQSFEAILGNDTPAILDSETKPEPGPETELIPEPGIAPNTPADLSSSDDILASTFDLLLSDPASTPPAADAVDTNLADLPRWKIHFVPEPQILQTGNEPSRIFRELASLGALQVEAHTDKLPDFAELTVDECFLSWTLFLEGDVSKEDIFEVFDWVVDECSLDVVLENPIAIEAVEVPPVEPVSQQQTAAVTPVAAPVKQATTAKPVATAGKAEERSTAVVGAGSSIRVGIDKVDSLINLVGELVITQSMLSELGSNFEMDKVDRLTNGLEQLLQNTKELQESVMRIRMLPISFAFNRFPRMIRDIANKIDKKVDLKIHGENTELDKTVMEKINDPLVHLVRNAIDHGIETPSERLANGKSEEGTIQLDAYHQGGNIVIEIRDDGRGIDADIILEKAIAKGIVGPNEELTESRIFELIFEPGFSTAAVVSDISGRGVGMDVVRRNIQELGGRIEISSELGKGSTFKVHLPLTLAILDGQLVRVGSETYIIPLISIVESLQIKSELVNQVSGSMMLYRLREDNVPIIPIYQAFGLEADNTELADALLVVVEDNGNKVGLLVDDLLAQQQVVIKSLESNYQRVEGISGATILGDGSVSMILDIPGLIYHASRPAIGHHGKAA